MNNENRFCMDYSMTSANGEVVSRSFTWYSEQSIDTAYKIVDFIAESFTNQQNFLSIRCIRSAKCLLIDLSKITDFEFVVYKI